MAKRGAPIGNTNGAKGKMWLAAIERRFAQRPKDLEDIADAVVRAAKAGEPWAVTELGNRLDGKPVQQVDMSGEVSLTRTYRDMNDEELLRIAAQAHETGREEGETLQ